MGMKIIIVNSTLSLMVYYCKGNTLNMLSKTYCVETPSCKFFLFRFKIDTSLIE